MALFAATACSDDVRVPDSPVKDDGDKITLDISLNIAEITRAQSRAFSENPNYSDLELHVLEFEYRSSTNPIDNPMSHNYNLEEDAITNEGVNDDGDLHFNLTLALTDQPRVLHFIAVPRGTNLEIGSANEGLLLPSLSVDNETPAYWQRVIFEKGYGEYDERENFTPIDDLKNKLTHVPMLCNFARITLNVANNAGFTLEGFAVLNQPTKGSIVPWNSTRMVFPDFLSGASLLTYLQISANYNGYWPFSQTADVTAKEPVESMFTPAAKYIYERPHSTLYSPLIILKGRKTGSTTSMYYKLDLGKKNDEKLFDFYNILRNFSYDITVTSVLADGYSSAEAALSGVVFNNFSFDVNTRQMVNVSDGTNMLQVNSTTFVVTNNDERVIKFLYRFRTNISNNDGTLANNRITTKDLETGEAIENIEYGEQDANGWKEITITTAEPTSTRKSQDFIIYDTETGLGRTIRIVVRNPWEYISPALYGVNYDTYQQYQTAVADYSQWRNVVSSNWSADTQQPMTVSFMIDNDIPEAMFPLQFYFEANPQNIENNKVGNLLVNTGSSMFDNKSATTIRYVKTVSWIDYNTELTADHPTAAKVTLANGEELHFVRARFLTISTITNTQVNTIRVYNPYFRVRIEGTPVTYNQYLDLTYTPGTGNGPDLTH